MKYGTLPGSIGVHSEPGRPSLVGMAHGYAWNEDGVEVWRLSIGGKEIPGRWLIIDREFRPADATR